MSKEEFENFRQKLQAVMPALGVSVDQTDQLITVVSPLKVPGAKAGFFQVIKLLSK